MNALFEFYWTYLGKPWSAIKGYAVDFIPFNLTELLVWIGLACSLIWLVNFKKIYFKRGAEYWNRPPIKWGLVLLGPTLLFLLTSGQGAMPFSPAPTFLRPSLHQTLTPPEVTQAEFSSLRDSLEIFLNREFNASHYQKKQMEDVVTECNDMLDSFLGGLNLPSGRTVLRIKNLMGLSKLFGLSYGGPAYHDPLTGEVALASPKDYPTSKSWRIHATCHEIAHAKGYSREMDAEILTALIFLNSADSLYRSLGYLMFLQKSKIKFTQPEFLRAERKKVREQFQKVRQKQFAIRFLTWINRKLSIRNRSAKYGDRDPHKAWDKNHPYFSTVIYLQKNFL